MIIDIFHDTACPWCRIGRKNLQLALEKWTGEAVEVRYHAYFLNEDIPAEGAEFHSYMDAKGGGRVPLQQWFDAPRRAGEAVGLVFSFEAIERAPNTLLSHRLIALTPENQREELIGAIYDAYFQHGRDIGDLGTLLAIASEQGLDDADLAEKLRGDAAEAQVIHEAHEARSLGVSGVPFFIFDNLLAFSGAQPPALILEAMKQAAAIIPDKGQSA